MDVTSQQIVTGLIAHYKQQGIDLSYVLGDPTFQSLRLKEKVEAIHKFAATLYNGTSTSLTKNEKSKILSNSLFTGAASLPAFVALAAGSPVKQWFQSGEGLAGAGKLLHNKALLYGAGGAVLGSLAVGAMKGLLETRETVNNRRALKSQLYRAAVDPSIQNTVGVLSHSATQNLQHPFRKRLLEGAYAAMDKSWDAPKAPRTFYSKAVNMEADFRNLPTSEHIGNDADKRPIFENRRIDT